MSNKQEWGSSAIRGDNQLVSVDRVLCVVPKNKTSEQRVTVKTHQTRKTKMPQKFVDIREFWFKHGPMEEPLPSRKGTMIHREHIVVILIALLGDLDHEEVDGEQLNKLMMHVERIRKGKFGG